MDADVGLASIRKFVESSPRRLPKELYQKARPVRNAFVESAQGEHGLILKVPLQSQGTGLMGLLAKWSHMPDIKEFELEEVGAFVWELCDGQHTTEGIARKLRERFKMNRLEAETALAAFLEMLSKRRLITLTIPKSKK